MLQVAVVHAVHVQLNLSLLKHKHLFLEFIEICIYTFKITCDPQRSGMHYYVLNVWQRSLILFVLIMNWYYITEAT